MRGGKGSRALECNRFAPGFVRGEDMRGGRGSRAPGWRLKRDEGWRREGCLLLGCEAGFRIPSPELLLPDVVPGFSMICGSAFILSAVSSEGEFSTRGGKMVIKIGRASCRESV